VVLVIYAILTEQNIAKLFLAAFVPGVLAAIGYMITIRVIMHFSPGNAQIKERIPYSERLTAFIRIWPVLLVFFLVVGGIYLGWFTPTEAAAVGTAGTGIIAILHGGLNRKTLSGTILGTASNTGMIFLIVLGAAFFNAFFALTQVSQGFSPWVVLIMILCLVFGCVMDSLSMILLTVPIFFPIISSLDFGMTPEETAIWFGILVSIIVEVGLITPPVVMNLFVINSMDRTTKIGETYKYVLPFVVSDIIPTAILVGFPGITLVLLRQFY
jgi:C4-dicarboxylate transporter DctM subunit